MQSHTPGETPSDRLKLRCWPLLQDWLKAHAHLGTAEKVFKKQLLIPVSNSMQPDESPSKKAFNSSQGKDRD